MPDEREIEKKALRNDMKARLRALESGAFAAAGKAVARRVVELPAWRESRAVCAFMSMPREIDTSSLLAEAAAAGKTLLLPRTEGERLSFRVCSVDGPWAAGPFGIREPLPNAPEADFGRLFGPILVLVPGLAFDRRKRRLGRGKGYYDRFLRSLRALRPDSTVIGIGLAEQLVPSVPINDYDEPLDLVVIDR